MREKSDKGDKAEKAKKADKGDLRARFTGQRSAPRADDHDTADYERLAAELADNVGKTVRVATELGIVVAENIGLKMMELMSPAKPAGQGRHQVRDAATAAFTTAKEKLPDFSGQTASKITDLVVGRSFAALRAVQQTIQKTRRPR